MRHISKKISLEVFKSRMPGVIPAFNGRDERPVFFGNVYNSVSEWNNHPYDGSVYTSNYNMIPCNVVLSGASLNNGELYLKNCGLTTNIDNMILSYRTIVEIYHFFEDYYHLLYDYGSCGKVYESAEDYFYQESKSLAVDRLKYPYGVEFYQGLDAKYNRLGGAVTYDYFRSNFFPMVKFSDLIDKMGLEEYEREKIESTWNIRTFTYSDLIKWDRWFSKRVFKYKDYANVEDCRESDDCCDCEEFFKRGGNAFAEKIKNEIEKIKSRILLNNTIFATLHHNANEALGAIASVPNDREDLSSKYGEYYAFYPSMLPKVNIANHVNAIGEQDIISEEWVAGRDYSIKRNGGYTFIVNGGRQTEDVTNRTQHIIKVISKKGNGLDEDIQRHIVSGGTVVTHNGESYIIQSGFNGYKFDDKFKEIKFGNDLAFIWNNSQYTENRDQHWMDYTDGYIAHNIEEFVSFANGGEGMITYAYTNDGRVVFNPTDGDLRLSEQYELNDNNGLGFVVYNESPLPIEEIGYIIDTDNPNGRMRNRRYLVEYSYTNTPYITYNNKTLYGSRERNAQGVYEWCIDICGNKYFLNNVVKERVVRHDGYSYVIDGGSVEIDGYSYPCCDGYIVIEGRNHYLPYNCNRDNFVLQGVDYDESGGCVLQSEIDHTGCQEVGGIVLVPYYFIKYDYEVITGYTESKLEVFKDHTLEDNIGNKFECLDIALDTTVEDGQELGLPYTVGRAMNVESQYVYLNENDEEPTQIYWGDYLDTMEFYLESYDGTKSELEGASEILLAREPRTGNDFDISKYDSVSIINNLLSFAQEHPDEVTERIHCVFTYYLGNSLRYNETSGNFYIEQIDAEGTAPLLNGIRYIEDVVLRRTRNSYFDDVYLEPKTIFYYELEKRKVAEYSEQYGDMIGSEVAYFETRVPRLNSNGQYQYGYGEEFGFDKHMNQIALPTYTQEYQVGITSPEIVDGDIYIDRGSAAAFEKLLKLGEVSSLSALEQYSNGFFNITQNT